MSEMVETSLDSIRSDRRIGEQCRHRALFCLERNGRCTALSADGLPRPAHAKPSRRNLRLHQACVADQEATAPRHIINVYGALAGSGTDGYAASASRDALHCFTRYVANQVRDANVCVVVLVPASCPIAADSVSTEDRQGMPGVEMSAGRFVLASNAGMDLSARLVTCEGGYLDAAY